MDSRKLYLFRFHQGEIPLHEISELINAGSHLIDAGAYNIFLGQVRNDLKEEGKVVSIDYTANEIIAVEVMQKIMKDARTKFDVKSINVVHSLGNVPFGNICLVVYVVCKHRKESFKACEYLVERLKKELPVWGKEIIENNTHTWKINT